MPCDYRKALDLARQGKWDEAHQLVQVYADALSCHIHGYLHRVEGDPDNAKYWYGQAGVAWPQNSLEEEFERLAKLADDAEQQGGAS
jgi:hypothetical protein